MTNWNQTRGLNSISMTRRLMNQTVQLVPALLPSRSYERTFLGWLRWSLLNKSSVVVLVFPSVLYYSCSFTFRHCLHKAADMCFLSPCLSLSPIFLLLPHIQGLVPMLVLLHLQLQVAVVECTGAFFRQSVPISVKERHVGKNAEFFAWLQRILLFLTT